MAVKSHRKVGRPNLGRSDLRTVAAKFDDADFGVLEELARRKNMKPGPFVSDFMAAFLATVDIAEKPGQEALPIELAG